MKIKTVDLVKMALLLFVFTLIFAPTEAFAAANIFDTIQAKMLSTAKDVRKIVYVISGFGLVMFSVLAIFNKISFKHLGYIMISLSLLAMMTPFINYFSGAGIDESDFNYGDFIIESSDASGYSNAGSQQNCEPNCPSEGGHGQDYAGGEDPFNPDGYGAGAGDGAGTGGYGAGAGDGAGTGGYGTGDSAGGYGASAGAGGAGVGGYGASAGAGGYGDDVPTIDGGILDEVVVTAEAPSKPSLDLPTTLPMPDTGLAIPPSYQEQLANAGNEKKPFKDRLKDAISWGKGAVDTVNNAIDTYESVAAGVGAVVSGAEQVGNILNGDGNIVQKIGDLSSTIGSTIDTSGDWLGRAATEGGSVLDALGVEGATDAADAVVDRITGAQDGATEWTNIGSDAASVGRDAENIFGNRLGLGRR